MPVVVGGPFFEDFHHGQLFAGAPGLTLTAGHAALHEAVAGDRLGLALGAPLCRAVTGSDRLLVHPNLVCDVAIGHSSEATHRVRANLFYRGLVLARPVFVGDTLRTRTEGDVLRTELTVEETAADGTARLRAVVSADGGPVLDWRFVALVA